MNDLEKDYNRIRTIAFSIWVVALIFGIGLIGFGVYVMWHFITKLW